MDKLAQPIQSRVVRLAELQIDPGQLDEYKAALREEIEASIRLEPGVLTLYAVSVKGDPAQIRMFEIYTDAAAYEAHLQTPHFKKYKTGTQGMVKSLVLVEIDPYFARREGEVSLSANDLGLLTDNYPVSCRRCHDRAWVCEAHPEKPWPHDDCPGPGELCSCEAGRTFKQQLDQQRAGGGEYSPEQRLEPVTLGEPLWISRKEHHTAEARVRSIPGIGLELRFSVDGELYYSHRFTAWDALEAAAGEKRSDFEARGWSEDAQIAEYGRREKITDGVILASNVSHIRAIAVDPKVSESLPWLDPTNDDESDLGVID